MRYSALATFLFLCMPGSVHAGAPVDNLRMPGGFRAEILVDNVPKARSMALGEKGTLFVGTQLGGTVYAIRGALEGKPEVLKVAEKLTMPNGVAFRDGTLYVAEQKRIIRFPGIEGRLDSPPVPEPVGEPLPFKVAMHSWKYIAFGPDGKLYVAVGSPCNVCEEPEFGVILRMNPDGSGREVYARGIRNSVGFDWDPLTRELWFTDNGRDMLGDDVPPDELNHATRAGLDFGFPYCHAGSIPEPDPDLGSKGHCEDSVPPAQKLGPHVAPLAIRFYTGKMFPEQYRKQLFIAEHGSWNRSKAAGKTGYRITMATIKDGVVTGYEPFAEGWLQGSEASGRPVDLLVAPDGSLLVSDDQRGVIYRISYERPN